MLLSADGRTAVAADPDRDAVWWTDVASGAGPVNKVALTPGDEPGRVVEDAAGFVHVALRSGGAVVTIDLGSGSIVRRTPVCAAPRGLAYDADQDQVHVACASGELVSLAAADDTVVRTLVLDPDLRDVVVVGGGFLAASTLRRAEVMLIDAAGAVRSRTRPFALDVVPDTEPSVAWRMVKVPGANAVALAYQLASTAAFDVEVTSSYTTVGSTAVSSAVGYLGFDLTAPDAAPVVTAWAIDGALPVDIAFDLAGTAMGVAVYGSGSLSRIPLDASGQPELPATPSQVWATSVAVDGNGNAIAFLRESAGFVVEPGGAGEIVIPIDAPSLADTGHSLFHLASQPGGSLACASCHPEGRDDGRVWSFTNIGLRRTQSLVGGLLPTAPFHWEGDLPDLDALVLDVFTKRMGGLVEDSAHVAALARFLEAIPRVPVSPSPASPSLANGRALFESPELGCTACHDGPHLTNNATVDVGTGMAFQVPSLIGVGLRPPYMHDGCAPTLADCFGPCGGGDQHGHTSQLTPADIADLVVYLGTL